MVAAGGGDGAVIVNLPASDHLEAGVGMEGGHRETEEENQTEGCLVVEWEAEHQQKWQPWLLWRQHRSQVAWIVDEGGRVAEEGGAQELEGGENTR